MRRIFLLSPAKCSGLRAGYLLREGARSELARRLRGKDGAPLGEIFCFMSGLYFRGKLQYAHTFGHSVAGYEPALVIAPGFGFVGAQTHLTLAELRAMAEVPVDLGDSRYSKTIEKAARKLAGVLGPSDQVVLLGSIATRKYVDPLLSILPNHLYFPREFVGRGDMSRGALMLRCARAGNELEYVLLSGMKRHGPRPARLPRLGRIFKE
jgi:hypothetical protein